MNGIGASIEKVVVIRRTSIQLDLPTTEVELPLLLPRPLHALPALALLAIPTDLLMNELLLLGEAEGIRFIARIAGARGLLLGRVLDGLFLGGGVPSVFARLTHAHTVDPRAKAQNSARAGWLPGRTIQP